MRMRLVVVAVVVVVASVAAVLLRPPITQPALAHELIRMNREDNTFSGGGFFGAAQSVTQSGDATAQLAAINARRQRHADRLKEIVARYGWPTEKMVGREGTRAALHQLHDFYYPEFIPTVLPLVIRSGDHSPEVARLVDVIAVRARQPQTYSTQWKCENGVPEPETPVKDPANLDARRRAFGLDPIVAERKVMAQTGFCAGLEFRGTDGNRVIIKRAP